MDEIKRYLPGGSMILTQSTLHGTYVSSADHEAEIERLRTEADALWVDAERYRWLRDSAPDTWDVTRWLDKDHQEVHVQDYLDEAIDAAMKEHAE